MLSFYLVFIFIDREYYDTNRLLCMSEYLFKVQLRNRLEQGLLKRFSINCYGKHHTLEDIKRSDKAKKYKELRQKELKSGNKEYDKYFFKIYSIRTF